MQYHQAILAGQHDPQQLETLYQKARQENQLGEFIADLQACYRQASDNLLYAAWHCRLQQTVELTDKWQVNWWLAIPLAILTGLILWGLSWSSLDLTFANNMPYVAQIWSLIGGTFVITFLSLTAKQHYRRAGAVTLGWLFFAAYVMTFSIIPNDRHYQWLMTVHLPLLAWLGVGLTLLGYKATAHNYFAFIIKSIELFVLGGIYAIGGVIFMMITQSLFWTLNIEIPESITNLMMWGGLGLIIVLATASTYNPLNEPVAQNFRHGLSGLVSTLMRLLMPLTLLVLIIFSYFILQPTNFWRPFNDRDALIVYNAMLFAVMLLLMGAIPVHADDLQPKLQTLLRKGVLAIAGLTVMVSLYALSATLYRTYLGTLTMNRLTVIGWNIINITILLMLIVQQLRAGSANWLTATHKSFRWGIGGYLLWTVFVILAVPFIFGQGLQTGWSRVIAPAVLPTPDAALSTTPLLTPTPRPMVTPTPTLVNLTTLPAGCPPACQGAELAGAYLRRSNLREANLQAANLRGADLQLADLQAANLRGADLRGANLSGANLERATLHETQIDYRTKLDDQWELVWQVVNHGAEQRDLSRQAHLGGADLRGANLRGADLSFGMLHGSDLRGADLSGAVLNHVTLHEAIIDSTTQLADKWRLVWEIINEGTSGRDLNGLNLSQANLSGADLRRADLSRAILTDTELTEANLYEADLRGAILLEPDDEGELHQADLHLADLAGVQLDESTRLSDDWRLVWEIVNHGARNRDLSGRDLSRIDLHGIDFRGATLVGTKLNGANLQRADLSGADLNGADLSFADLTGATITGANFYEANLLGVSLPIELSGANFRKANLMRLNLTGFNLRGLNLSRANLSQANLAEANLQGADLSEAHLERTYLWGANLAEANLRGAFLNEAYLWGANLTGADLTGAEIGEAVMPPGSQ